MKTDTEPVMESTPVKDTKGTEKHKHRFLKVCVRIAVILLLLALICGAVMAGYALHYRSHYKISFYQETSPKVSCSIRIAVISDIHNREYGEHNAALLSDLRALKPDLILFPGDMVIREQEDYQAALDLISESAEIAPCYGVLGNHESERIYYKDDKELPKKLENAGLKLLRNASEKILIGRDTVQLFGTEGTAYGFEQYGGREFMEKTEADPDAYGIVMAHIPVLFDALSDYDFDLGIAGHVHGGIIKLPFIGGLYTQEEGFFPRLCVGKYTLDKGQSLIISAGLGDSAFFPPRINNPPELVIIDVDRY